MQIIIIS